ncbi:DUF732 domain-containing protein [Actinoplanes couchii]|uniref:DUF732 domain-containing protein n=1 Tax=Actinoplanes couchii TaxID=403638 RepID=A0ABQ3XG93_9ACTN|nr:DUF732 domain-containing protein [Actinoplanes couchii]MDR6321010.1 hypothetical protein [Actinoplanes couchii]GID57521.1 hypothetical protein Aco03nite_059250 [Actinoplanes couchii]
MNRLGLGVLTGAMAVMCMGGCGGADSVPQWRDPQPSQAVTGPVAEPLADDGPEPPAPSEGTWEGLREGPLDSSPGSVTPSSPEPGADFVAAVRGKIPEATMDLRNEEIAEIGRRACDSLTAGDPRRSVVEDLGDFGLEKPDARELIKAARSTLCAS